MARVSAITAPFEVEYAVNPRGRSAEIEDTLTIAPPPAGLLHRRDRVARDHEHAVDIDLHDPAPILRRDIDDTAAPADPDIVVEAGEPAKPRDRLGDHRACLSLVCHIGDERRGGAALRLDHRDSTRGTIEVEIDNENLGAGAGKKDRRGTAIADAVIRRPATSDDRHLAGKAKRVFALRSIRHYRVLPKPIPVMPLTSRSAGSSLSPLTRGERLCSPSPRLRERVGVKGNPLIQALPRCSRQRPSFSCTGRSE
jgi:hypothetical protein